MKPAITISNYEEFFLLYTDGELSASEKQAVEQFVQENPHLAEELGMLQQMRLPADELLFADKALLYKHGEAGISLENYETQFLSYVDNELDASQKNSVETFVLQHPALQDEFMLLKKTKLEPETILFPDKASLYRKEEKERRIIYMRWQRVAVAAALIGVIALVWTLFPSDNTTVDQPIANAEQPVAGKTTDPQTVSAQPGTANVVTQKQNIIAGKIADPANNRSAVQSQPVNNVEQNTVTAGNVSNEQPKEMITARVEPSQTVNTPIQSSQTGGVNATLSEQGTLVTPRDKEKDDIIIQAANTNTALVAQPAVYKELDTEDDKKSLYVGSLEINKDKLRGFFRKATSLFRGKAKQEEEERVENAPSSSNTRSLK